MNRINRNIMECKELFKWSLQFPDLRINRNIMECKDRWPDISSSFIAVLIETLWNVKDGLYNGSVWCETVLIETLWNVKLERSRSTGTVVLGINRNIMECKGDWYGTRQEALWVLIETLWNVKFELHRSAWMLWCINRNIMECKGV